ncbi:hypothetical protein J6590_052025 [Homalodisca vitripennis]|nr:hypothetical protein J6590_052025 [Homalodisca vitripennis]
MSMLGCKGNSIILRAVASLDVRTCHPLPVSTGEVSTSIYFKVTWLRYRVRYSFSWISTGRGSYPHLTHPEYPGTPEGLLPVLCEKNNKRKSKNPTACTEAKNNAVTIKTDAKSPLHLEVMQKAILRAIKPGSVTYLVGVIPTHQRNALTRYANTIRRYPEAKISGDLVVTASSAEDEFIQDYLFADTAYTDNLIGLDDWTKNKKKGKSASFGITTTLFVETVHAIASRPIRDEPSGNRLRRTMQHFSPEDDTQVSFGAATASTRTTVGHPRGVGRQPGRAKRSSGSSRMPKVASIVLRIHTMLEDRIYRMIRMIKARRCLSC